MELENQCAKHLLQDLPGLACVIKQNYCPQEELGFTLQQIRLMSLLEKRTLSTSELASMLNVTLPAISRMTHMMIDSECLSKAITSKDRRQIKLSLTSKGRKLLKEAHAQAYSRILPDLQSLKESEKKIILKSFEIIQRLIFKPSTLNSNEIQQTRGKHHETNQTL